MDQNIIGMWDCRSFIRQHKCSPYIVMNLTNYIYENNIEPLMTFASLIWLTDNAP